MTPSLAQLESTLKRKAMPLSITTPTRSSPRQKHPVLLAICSSHGHTYIAAVSIVATVDNHVIFKPPSVICNETSQTSTLATMFKIPSISVAKHKRGSNNGMIELVPKTEFLKWPREYHHRNKN